MKIELKDRPTTDCFALSNDWQNGRKMCMCLRKRDPIKCGTKKCPFYKPQGCSDWVRLEEGDEVYVIPPEEYKIQRKKNRD